MKVPTPIDGFNTDSARPRSTTSGEASLVWEDGDTPCGNTCFKVAKNKQVNTEKGKHMDSFSSAWKLRVVETQDSVADIQVVFVEIQVNFKKH